MACGVSLEKEFEGSPSFSSGQASEDACFFCENTDFLINIEARLAVIYQHWIYERDSRVAHATACIAVHAGSIPAPFSRSSGGQALGLGRSLAAALFRTAGGRETVCSSLRKLKTRMS